jgi:hypothetical protein
MMVTAMLIRSDRESKQGAKREWSPQLAFGTLAACEEPVSPIEWHGSRDSLQNP